jgi:hypothetical protein
VGQPDARDRFHFESVSYQVAMSKLDEACRRLRANDPILTALKYVSARGLMRGGLHSWGWDVFAM